MNISEAIAGHDIQKAIELSKQQPSVTSIRDRRKLNGDIGKLMPMAQAKCLHDLQPWIDHLSSQNVPCVVVKRGSDFLLYKERRCQTGTTKQYMRN